MIPFAQEKGYVWYQGVSNAADFTSEELLAHNRAPIEQWISEGRKIIDVGPEPGRDFYSLATSPNFGMEHNIVRGYHNYVRQIPEGEGSGRRRQVAIEVTKCGDRYHVSVSPPQGPNWRSREPLTATEILARLSKLGCHSTDITDALCAADPNWTTKMSSAAEISTAFLRTGAELVGQDLGAFLCKSCSRPRSARRSDLRRPVSNRRISGPP